MKIKDLKKLIAQLPDNASVVEMDHDGAHLVIHKGQIKIDAGALVFVPYRVEKGN